ncbi:MAG: TonB-dependent receptor [Phenylobacterium sp.]|nr:TonB-dependent receptor [Phenylobacterium sp.]
MIDGIGRAAWLATSSAVCIAVAGPAYAQSKTFDIPAQPVASAISMLGRQADVQIVASRRITDGKQSSPVRGVLTVQEALAVLLQGTGLEARQNGANTYTIMLASSPAAAVASAEDAPSAAPTEPTALSELVVTSTRVLRAGYAAPTPTTMVGADQIQANAPAFLADYLNQLPALSGSYGTRVLGLSSGPNSGANILNLRNLGPARTLVLLDGRRIAPTLTTGQVDINLLPQALVKRVDVVTGGASAGWGSDAVAGVVNFVLDTGFTGLKASLQGGQTQEGDAKNAQGQVTFGTAFDGGRGHFLISAEANRAGRGDRVTSRDWYNATKVIANPAFVAGGAQPPQIVASGVGLSQGTQGGLISSGPLRGIQFVGPNGTPTPFDFGFVSGLYSVRGSAQDYGRNAPLQNPVRSANVFTRISYDLTPDISAYGEFSYAEANAKTDTVGYTRLNNVTIRNDNAYLDPGVRAQLAAAGQTSFLLGTTNENLGVVDLEIDRKLTRVVAGVEGRFGDGWTWSVYAQHGETDFKQVYSNNPIVARYNLAVDAVRNPVTGAIVCRSTLTNPGNGCVPLSVFGERAPTPEQRAYVTGASTTEIIFMQDVAAASLRGEPFSTWAGPVSVATGVEYRRDRFVAKSDPLSQAVSFYIGNTQPARGVIEVKEGFIEAVVPLLSDVAFAKTLDLNGAARITDYSTSGSVTTWKAGLTWAVNDELRFRGTRSRDIRAGNQSEVFTARAFGVQSVADPVTRSSYIVSLVTQGNAQVQPEIADTSIVGVVYQPEWLPGFSASVDYYEIRIRDAIVTPTAQQTVDSCARGQTSVCDSIIRDGANAISQIFVQAQNVNRERESGVDIEASYRVDLASLAPSLAGDLSFRGLATYTHERVLEAFGTVVDFAGTNADSNNRGSAVPHWRGNLSSTYTNGPVTTTLSARYIGPGRISNIRPLIGNGDIKAITYFDLYVAYRPDFGIAASTEFYAVVENLFDQDPPASPTIGSSAILSTGANGFLYDLLGRQFRAGVRMRF